ncbi:MAG: TetR family transcriptional regulator [Actinomycetales bacterium]|nr:TetR family transcriptional regulator [Actinomycetales bacterium]
MVEPIGRRERKRLATHHALRAAALRLGAERGIRDVTVEEIATAADVSVRTFYDHFPSKEDAIIGFDAWRVDQLRDALADRPADEAPLEALRVVMGQLFHESSGEWPLRMRAINADPALLGRMFVSFIAYERALVEVIAQRTGLDSERDPYPALVTAVATAAFRASMTTARASGGALDPAATFDAAITRLGAALSPPQREDGPTTC